MTNRERSFVRDGKQKELTVGRERERKKKREENSKQRQNSLPTWVKLNSDGQDNLHH